MTHEPVPVRGPGVGDRCSNMHFPYTIPSKSNHDAEASMLCSVQNSVQIAQGHVLILKDATFDTAGTYECVITVPEIQEMQTSGVLTVKVRGK